MKPIFVETFDRGKLEIPFFSINDTGLQKRVSRIKGLAPNEDRKRELLRLALSMVDLTTLEGADTPEKARQLCHKAMYPISDEMIIKNQLKPLPLVAAVCVYPNLVPYACDFLKETNIQVASVATAFPSGLVPIDIKLLEVERAISFGADEIDMVIDRGSFLSGDFSAVYNEIFKVKEVCRNRAHLKVILETAELETYENIRQASWIAMEAGADFIKTSTGKASKSANLFVTLVMLEAISDFYEEKGVRIGMKPAGGIRTSRDALEYLNLVDYVLGDEWLSPSLFRFGASSLLDNLIKSILELETENLF